MSEQSDQDLLLIIKELNDNAENFHTPEVLKLRDNIRSQGLFFSLKLCELATSNATHPNAKYLLFTILSSLLHPRTPPELLMEIFNQFIPLAQNETSHSSKMSIYRCIANAFYHLASEDSTQDIENLLQLIGDDSIIFLSELMCVLKCSFDVPMLALKNFVIFSKVIPEILPTIISCFFNDYDVETYYILDFCLDKLQRAPMEFLLSNTGSENSFNTDEFIQQITLILNSKMPDITNAFENLQMEEKLNHIALSYLVKFFSKSVLYGLEPSITEGVLFSIFNIPFDSDNTYCFCEMIKTVYRIHKEVLSDELMTFLYKIAIENAKVYNLENLKIVLSTVSYFLSYLVDCPTQETEANVQPQIFTQIVEHVLPLLFRLPPNRTEVEVPEIKIISMTGQAREIKADENTGKENEEEEDEDDNDEQYESDKPHREDIMECLAYFSLAINPLPSLEMIEGIFDNLIQSHQANFYICDWIIGLISKFLKLAEERESNEVQIIIPFALRIVSKPIIEQYAQTYSSIEEYICCIFLVIDNKDFALPAFHLAIKQYSSDDSIMEKAIYLANKYKFVLLDEIPVDAPLSAKVLTLLSHNSPSPAIEQRINELIESGDTNKMQEAAALIIGLQKAAKENEDFEFETLKYAIQFSENKMFAEALKISYDDPETCYKIIDMASGITFEEDVFDRIVLRALKAAIKNCKSQLTERALIFANYERSLDSKTVTLIINLFKEHKKKLKKQDETAEVTDASLMILLGMSKVLMADSTLFYNTASSIIESLIFFFDRVFPLIDNDFWLSIICYYLDHNLEEFFYEDYCDLLFQFFMKDFERYQSIFMEALSRATDNSEDLFSYLHNEIDTDTPKMRNLYHTRFIYVYKAFSYYKSFTSNV